MRIHSLPQAIEILPLEPDNMEAELMTRIKKEKLAHNIRNASKLSGRERQIMSLNVSNGH